MPLPPPCCCLVAGKCSCQVPICSWHCFPSNFLIHAPGRSDGGANVTASSPLIPKVWFLYLDLWCHCTPNLLPFASNTPRSMGFALLPFPHISTMLKTELVLSIWADCINRPSLWVQQQTWFQPCPCLPFPSMGGIAFEAIFFLLYFCVSIRALLGKGDRSRHWKKKRQSAWIHVLVWFLVSDRLDIQRMEFANEFFDLTA